MRNQEQRGNQYQSITPTNEGINVMIYDAASGKYINTQKLTFKPKEITSCLSLSNNSDPVNNKDSHVIHHRSFKIQTQNKFSDLPM